MEPPKVLERGTYRYRRARDAAFILPVVGAVLVVAPVLWGGGSTRVGGVYLFLVWLALILLSFGLSRRLRDAPKNSGGTDDLMDPRR